MKSKIICCSFLNASIGKAYVFYFWPIRFILQVGIDQFIQAPIFTVFIFGFLGALEGKSLDGIKKQLDDDYWKTMKANCK